MVVQRLIEYVHIFFLTVKKPEVFPQNNLLINVYSLMVVRLYNKIEDTDHPRGVCSELPMSVSRNSGSPRSLLQRFVTAKVALSMRKL